MAALAELELSVRRKIEDIVDDVVVAIPDHIRLAQRVFEARQAFTEQHALFVYTHSVSTFSASLPTDFITIRRKPYYVASGLVFHMERSMKDSFILEGGITNEDPKEFILNQRARTMSFGPGFKAGSTYTFFIPYWGRLETLTDPEDTNFWSETMPEALEDMAAHLVLRELRDPMAAVFYDDAMKRFFEEKARSKRDRLRIDGQTLVPTEQIGSRNTRYAGGRRRVL